MSKYLVTGGAGFIGSHIVERLVKLGQDVRVLDNFSCGKEENLKGSINKIELIKADIRDADAVNRAVLGVDFVLHQAALRSVPKSLSNPSDYNAVNIDGTLNLLEAAGQAKVKRFVFASSCAIYGVNHKFPQEESDLPKLISPYALTKLTGEYYCRIFSKNYGLETVSLRYFNVFGPRQALDDEYSAVIPKFITCILNNQPPPIHGSGKQSRDFIYIDNVVEANILATKIANIESQVINVANGKDYSILDLVALLNKIMGKSIKPIFTPPRPGDVLKALADISKAKKILKYKPKVNFEQGLKRTLEWFQKNK
ncbi:MAG: SDR family oxidoreductase [Candidatus Omnitrophota bacterium]|nr:SDR family oxidoreductase [Candidatus Omnitrophota bacterium]